MKPTTHTRFSPAKKSAATKRTSAKSTRKSTRAPSDFTNRYADLIGAAKGLPPDLAAQHDHYIHGTPKRK